MTCIWHDQHQARDGTAGLAPVCAELLAHCLLCLPGTPGSERGLFSGYAARPRLAGRQLASPPTAVGMQPQKCRLCSVWGLLTVAKRVMGTRAGLLCACRTADMLHRQSAAKPHHPPQKKKKKNYIFAAPQSLGTCIHLAYTQIVPMPWFIKKLEYIPAGNWDFTYL